MRRRIIRGMACLSLLAACGDSSHSSTPSPTSPSRSASVLAGTLVSVKIVGPSVVEPGTSTQFAATATFSDGSASDVTATAVWRSSNTSVFTVPTPGLVNALVAGEGSISFSYQNRSAFLNLVSLPAGTGIVGGHVTQLGFSIAGATIQVIGGPFAGRTATSDTSGFYRLYGVAGDLQIQASKDGYVPLTKPVTVAPLATPRRDQVLDFEITFVNQPAALAGSYLVTFSASASCAGKLPSDTMVRNYTATVTQDGVRLTVTLGGATFAGSSSPSGTPLNKFIGQVQPLSIQFTVGTTGFDYYYYYYYSTPGIIERLTHPQIGAWGFSQNDYLAITGTATASITPSALSATLNGTLSMRAPAGTGYRTLSSCTATDHHLTLVRQ
jgi:hypothetical protein